MEALEARARSRLADEAELESAAAEEGEEELHLRRLSLIHTS